MSRQWSELTTKQRTEAIIHFCRPGASRGDIVYQLSIGGITGQTRNAIIGHLSRNAVKGFSGDQRPKHKRPKRKPKAKKTFASIEKVKKSTEAPHVPVNSIGRPLIELTECECHYPLWASNTPLDQKLYCGVAIPFGSKYCAGHRCAVYASKEESGDSG